MDLFWQSLAGLIVVVFSLSLVISDHGAGEASDGERDGGDRALRLPVYPLSVPLVMLLTE